MTSKSRIPCLVAVIAIVAFVAVRYSHDIIRIYYLRACLRAIDHYPTEGENSGITLIGVLQPLDIVRKNGDLPRLLPELAARCATKENVYAYSRTSLIVYNMAEEAGAMEPQLRGIEMSANLPEDVRDNARLLRLAVTGGDVDAEFRTQYERKNK